MWSKIRFAKGSLLRPPLLALLALGVLICLVASLDWGSGGPWTASAQDPTPVPTGDSDLQGLLFGGDPGNENDWAQGNLCAGSRPDPGCYSDGEDVPHRALVLRDLIVGESYKLEIEHDFEDADGVPDLDNDSDGIIDERDMCPNEAEDLDGFEDEDGCPDM